MKTMVALLAHHSVGIHFLDHSVYVNAELVNIATVLRL